MTATEKRLASMRANLDNLENTAHVILEKGDAMTSDDRKTLLSLVNVAFHKGGKIDGIYSIDGTAACGFCEKMRHAAETNCLMICGMCYAARDFWKEAAFRRHRLNARILSTVLFTVEELQTLPIPMVADVRINEDGDVSNCIHGQNVIRLFKAFHRCSFGFWYKNTAAVSAALQAEGISRKEDKPHNVRFVHSSPLIGIPVRAMWYDDAIFTVYPDEETTVSAIRCGSYECNGRRCQNCGLNCYRPENNVDGLQHIAEVLRANKATVAAIRAAYDAFVARENNGK